ncbi:MAG: response regulator [Bacteroidota bacterium]
MIAQDISILLADDDRDDCLLFKEALEELPVKTVLTTVHDGEQLMQILTKNTDKLFHILFLDLNMPRKNGFTCLKEIKDNDLLKLLPVIIFSTSYDEHIADSLYKEGATHYICKPAHFSELKKVIQQVLTLVTEKSSLQPSKKNLFLIM